MQTISATAQVMSGHILNPFDWMMGIATVVFIAVACICMIKLFFFDNF